MTKLAVTLVQILDPTTKADAVFALAAQHLTVDDTARELFANCYKIADRFNFTPDFLGTRAVEYLGGTRISRGDEQEWARSDYFLVENNFHHTRSIHHHIAFGSQIDLHASDTEEWRSCIYALHELYWSWNWVQETRSDPSHIGETLDPFLRLVERPSAGQFARRGFYMSLYDADPALVSSWQSVAPALISLLYLHAEGFDRTHAATTLAEHMAQSTEFFVSFYNADALLSLGHAYPPKDVVEPYPESYPTGPATIEATQAALKSRLVQYTQRYEPYDLLPEYPALRYLDLSLTEFATNAKASQWSIRGELDRLSQQDRLRSLLGTIIALPRIDGVYYRGTALFVLRLPVARDLATKLLAEQGLSSNEQAIDGMKTSLLNTLVTILTIGALVVAMVQLFLALR